MLLDEYIAGFGKRIRVEIVNCGLLADDGGPVVSQGLSANFILFGDAKAGETFPVAGVAMRLPRDGNAAGRRRNLE